MCYSALVKQDLKYLHRRYGAINIRHQIDDYEHASSEDPKNFPALRERIYPGHYAPVIFSREGTRVTELMRYGAYPPAHILDPKKYTSFNARRDNLTSRFWSEAFLKHHGFIVLDGFYEWVTVKDLLNAGVVKLADIEKEFSRQSAERKEKILADGRKWKPTPTENKNPVDRQIIIEFKPEDGQDLLAPVIFSYGKDVRGHESAGFAIITDDPTPEIERAGHDRCPIILDAKSMDTWLDPSAMNADNFQEFLMHQRRVTFKHTLARAA